MRKRKAALTSRTWPGTINQASALLGAGELVAHSYFLWNINVRQGDFKSIFKHSETINIAQTTKVTEHPPILTNMSDSCFIPITASASLSSSYI